MTHYDLREFVCKECGHKVVVRPELPQDYTPTICTPCWDKAEPERVRLTLKIAAGLAELQRILTTSVSDHQNAGVPNTKG